MAVSSAVSTRTVAPGKLPTDSPARSVPLEGDVLWFDRAQAYALVRADSPPLPVEWLTDPAVDPGIADRDEIDLAVAEDRATIVAEGMTAERFLAELDAVAGRTPSTRDCTFEHPADASQTTLAAPASLASQVIATDGQTPQVTIGESLENEDVPAELVDGLGPRAAPEAPGGTSTFEPPCDTSLVDPGNAPSVRSVSLQPLRGTGALTRANGFLAHDRIDYGHDLQKKGFNHGLLATHDGQEVGLALVGHPNGQSLTDRRDMFELYRLASYPDPPLGLNSYLVSRAYRYAFLAGRDHFITYAGVQGRNRGTVYRGSNLVQTREYVSDSSRRTNRDGRSDHGTYRLCRYDGLLSANPLDGRHPGALDKALSAPLPRSQRSAVSSNPEDLLLVREDPLDHVNASIHGFLDRHGHLPDADDVVAIFGARHIPESVRERTTGALDPLAHSGLPADRPPVRRAHPVAAVALVDDEGSPRDPSSTARLAAIVAHDALEHPQNVCRWLVAAAAEWAHLVGYTSITARPGEQPASPLANETLAGMQFGHDPVGSACQTLRAATATFEGSISINLQANNRLLGAGAGGAQRTLEEYLD